MNFVVAKEAGEVCDALADGATAVLAGGQSLKPGAGHRRVIDIGGVAGFDTLVLTGAELRVAPLVRHAAFETDGVPGALGALLRSMVLHMGHPPVRARGTVLGSLAYAHPSAEWPAVAVMLDASVVLRSARGSRTVPAASFFTGPYATLRRPDELLTELRLPTLPVRTGVGYAYRRAGSPFVEAAALAAVTLSGGRVSEASLGLANCAPCPVRARTAEKTLLGSTLGDAVIAAAAECAASEVAPHPAVAELTRRALTQARTDLARGEQPG